MLLKSREWISKAFSCTVLSCVAACIINMIALAAGAEAWGFCYGGNPYNHKLQYLKDNYVGDSMIYEHLSDTAEQSHGQPSSYTVGSDYDMGNGTHIGYQSYCNGDTGSDKRLFTFFGKMKNCGGSTLKDTFNKGGKFYKATKESHNKDNCYAELKPSNSEYYSPLNILRMMQFYMVTRSGKSKGFIGGWPVQIDASNTTGATYKYNIEGARTINTVYKTFTGKSFDKSKALKEADGSTNCTESSLCYKLYKGKITMNKAMSQFKKDLKSAGVLVYDGKDLITAGAMTYEEYCVRSLRKDEAVRFSASNVDTEKEENIRLGVHTCYDNYTDSLDFNKTLESVKNQTFIVYVFRYLDEYGITFNSASEAAGDATGKTKSIFSDSGDERYFIISDDGFANYNSDSDGIGEAVLGQIKTYYKSASNKNYALGSNCDKPLMDEIALKIVNNMREAVNADTEPDGEAILEQYITYDKNSVVGKAVSKGVDDPKDAKLADSVNKTKNKATSGFDTMNKIDDCYVVQFFLNLCCVSGNSESNVVNNEYNKIISILSSNNALKNKLSLEQCYNMMYSLERIKDEGKMYNYTFFAKGNMQIGAILKYCKKNMVRVYKYFSKEKTGTNDKVIDSGKSKEKNPKQMYSDWCEAYTAVSSMGAKAYKRAHPNSTGSDATQAFILKYKNWKKNMKTGKTKYVDGVQHQDGFVPYALEKDDAKLKDTTTEYFTNSDNSLDGTGTMKNYNGKQQKKVWKWAVDTEQVNETIKNNFWLSLTNNIITLVGVLMLCLGFTLATLYCFDHVSGDLYEVVRKVSFGRLSYSCDKKARRKTMFKFLVLIFLSVLMYDGTLVQWAIWLLQIAYHSFTVK